MSGTRHGAPRWLILEGEPPKATVGTEAVAERLRVYLRDDPPNIPFDDNCEHWLDRYLAAVGRAETKLLPRRMQRALGQMADMTSSWAEQAMREGHYDIAEQWHRLRRIARPQPDDDDDHLDPYLVGEAWWDLVRPLFADLSSARRRRRYTRLRDLDQLLRAHPLKLSSLHERLGQIPVIDPVDKRVNAIILGVPR